jgi:hypothetical protein
MRRTKTIKIRLTEDEAREVAVLLAVWHRAGIYSGAMAIRMILGRAHDSVVSGSSVSRVVP